MKYLSVKLFCSFVFFFSSPSFSQNIFNSKFDKIVFGCYAKDIKDFEEFVKRAKKSGLKIEKAIKELHYNPVSFEEGVRLSFLNT